MEKLALGTAQFGLDYGISNSAGIVSNEEIAKILDLARVNKIDTIDTAHAYGTSEQKLGVQDLAGFKVISKFPSQTEGELSIHLEESLDRLKTQSLYGYLAHNFSCLNNNPKTWEQLRSEKENGKISKIGYSLYVPSELEKLLEMNMIPDMIQVPYSILDTRFGEYFSELKNLGVEIHTRSSFLQGLFFLQSKTLSEFFDPVKDWLEEFHGMFPSNKDKAGFLLNYVTSNAFVDRVVIGVTKCDELKQNLGALHDLQKIEFEEPGGIPERILLPYNWPKK